jgi:carbon monoxide dehydrogenase subunit G
MEASIVIKAPPEHVWAMLAWDRVHEWEEGYRQNLIRLAYTSEVRRLEDKYRVGATARVTLKQGDGELEITKSVENEQLTFHSRGKRLLATITCVLEPVEEGTTFTYSVDYELPSGILGGTFARTLKETGERDVQRSLETLKTILEQ